MAGDAPKFPGQEDRTLVVGRTGSGKTTGGIWLLTGCNFDVQPWLILNTKSDASINEIAAIKGVKTISVNDTPGDKGLYIVNPLPSEQEELNALLHRVWAKTNCGIFADEIYMLGLNSSGLNACLTQGRSRRIPMIICSQRPAWCSKFVFSESDYVMLFNLQRLEDRKTIGGLVPVDKNYRLAKHCSYWYNVADDRLLQFGPVPNSAANLKTFRSMFPPEQEQVLGVEIPPEVKRTARRVV